MTTEITQEQVGGDPFRYIDAKVSEFKSQRSETEMLLAQYGWTLRPNHEITGVWRARRWVEARTSLG